MKVSHKARANRRRRLPAIPPIGGDVVGVPRHGKHRTRERGVRAAARYNRAVKLDRQARSARRAERAAW